MLMHKSNQHFRKGTNHIYKEMRFKIRLKLNRKNGSIIPFNYQHEQSAAIYKIFSSGDAEYASWLHKNGFRHQDGKSFKLFNFSRFNFEYRTITDVGIEILKEDVTWFINILPERSTEEFINGLFSRQNITIGDKKYKVTFEIVGIEAEPPLHFTDEMIFQAESPVCVKLHKDNETKYLPPDSPSFSSAIHKGLIAKYETLNATTFPYDPNEFEFKLTDNNFRQKLITIKAGTPQETKVRGYTFTFSLKAPIELMKIAYEGGIGEQCSQGFGFIKEKKK